MQNQNSRASVKYNSQFCALAFNYGNSLVLGLDGKEEFERLAQYVENWASHQCKARDYESDFQNQTTDLVMSHIDRMNDVCQQTDPAERIIESFTTKFAPILETYLAAKFPGREPARKDSDAKPK